MYFITTLIVIVVLLKLIMRATVEGPQGPPGRLGPLIRIVDVYIARMFIYLAQQQFNM